MYTPVSDVEWRVQVVGFEWDAGNVGKCQKHGVPVAEIEALFRGSVAVYADPAHSLSEQRLRAIGRTSAGRALIVAFTLRRRSEEIYLRPISAWYMHAKEVSRYESGQAQGDAGAADR